jgi:hypothetical protein
VIAERTSKKVPETILVSQELLNDEKENQNTLSNIPNNIDENNLVPDLQQETGTPVSELSSNVPSNVVFTFKKNLIFLPAH